MTEEKDGTNSVCEQTTGDDTAKPDQTTGEIPDSTEREGGARGDERQTEVANAEPRVKPTKWKNENGTVQLGIKYLYKTGKLQVEIKQCWNVTARTGLEKVDAFVKMYLLPDKSKAGKRKTNIVRNTSDPIFNKKLEYTISSAQLENRSLYVSLWHNSLFGRNVFLGELTIPLNFRKLEAKPQSYPLKAKPRNPFADDEEEDIPMASNKSTNKPLKTDSPDMDKQQKRSSKQVAPLKVNSLLSEVLYCGDILLALKFVPMNSVTVIWDRDLESRGELHVHLKRGMNLMGFGTSGRTNAFCRLSVETESHVDRKHKTGVVSNDSNPQWDSRKRFENFGEVDLKDCRLELSVWNKDSFSTKLIGTATVTITGDTYDWTRAKCLSDSTLYMDEVLNHAETWIEFLVPLKAAQSQNG